MSAVLNSEQAEFLSLFQKVDAGKADLNRNLYQSVVSINDGPPQGHMYKIADGSPEVPNHVNLTRNLYFGVNLANTYVENGRTSNSIIGMVPAIYVEYDGKDFVDPNTTEYKAKFDAAYKEILAERQQAGQVIDDKTAKQITAKAHQKARLTVFMANRDYYLALLWKKLEVIQRELRPSRIVFSGGGFHCYWFLDKPKYLTTDEERKTCAVVQKNFVKVMEGDQAASDLARILRVPGTINTKYADNNIVAIKEQNDLRYSYEQIEQFINSKMPPKSKGSYRDNKPPSPEDSKKSKATVCVK